MFLFVSKDKRNINDTGSICIGLIILILALIGAWFVYKSYEEHRLRENLKAVVGDYKNLTFSVVSGDKKKQIDQAIGDLLLNFDKYSKKEINDKINLIKQDITSCRNQQNIDSKH